MRCAATMSLALTACSGAPGATKSVNFSSTNISLGGAASPSRSFGTAVAGDLGTSYGDVNRSNAQFAASEDTSRPPALAARGSGDYIVAFSQYDRSYITPPTNQSVFAAIPSVSSTTVSMPSTLGGYFYGSPTAVTFNFAPLITQAYGGSALMTFLGSSQFNGSAVYNLYAWVRAAGSDTWTGSGGGTAAPATISAATMEVDNRGPGLCDVMSAQDYAGGFLVGWCGPDAGNTSPTYIKRYSPFNGWSSASPVAITFMGGAGASIEEATAMADSAAPATGQGLDVAYIPDGSGNAWVAQVTSATPATPEDYNVGLRMFYGRNQSVTSISGSSIDIELNAAVTDDVLWSPKIFADSSTYVTAFFARAVAGVGTGDLYMYTANLSDANGDGDPDTVGATSIANLDDLDFNPAESSEHFAYAMATSPDGSKGALLFSRDADTIAIRVRSSSGVWPVVKTYDVPVAGLEFKHMSISIDNNGNMLLAVGLVNILGCGYPVGLRYSTTDGWSTATNLITSASPAISACDSEHIRVSTTLDNDNRGIVGFTCLPTTGACAAIAGATTRNYLLPYR